MAAVSTILLGVGAAASVAGTVGSFRAQNRAARAQQRQQTLNRRRSARQAIRAAQIQRATSLASAGGAGVADSSGFAGGVRSVSSRLGEGLGFSSQQSALSGVITRADQRARMFSGLASIGGSMMNLGVAGGATINNLLPGREPRTAPVPNLTGPVGNVSY